MGAFISNLACQGIAHVYTSYLSYRLLKAGATPAELAAQLCVWVVAAGAILFSERVTDGVFGWTPLYFVAKPIIALWLVHPHTRGASWFFAEHVVPAFDRGLMTLQQRR